MRLTSFALACAIAGLLPACGGPKLPASVSGLSKTLTQPPHEILGKTLADQDWIDETIAVGQEVLNWEPVKPRPAGLDAPAPGAPKAKAVAKPKAKPKKRWLPWPKKSAEPVPHV